MSYKEFCEMVFGEEGRPSETTQKLLSKFYKKNHKKVDFLIKAAILCTSLKTCEVW